jgi:PAS domain S-box-containing protein
VIFAVALLCAGQASTLTGTMAGQIVMEGFLKFRMRAWLRRLSTRLLAIIPAAITVYFTGDKGAYELLLLTQVVLSLQLPFAMIPLIHFTSDRRRMGEFANGFWLKSLAWLAAGVNLALNLDLAGSRIREWSATEGVAPGVTTIFVLPVAVGVVGLLVYITLAPFFQRSVPAAGAPESARPEASEFSLADEPIFLEQVDCPDHLSEARFDTFMKHLHGLAFIKDPAGRYVYFNKASSSMLGLSQDQVIAKRDDEIWPADLAKKFQKNDETVFRDRKSFEGIELIPHNGVMHSWIVYRFPIVERQSEAVFLGAVGVDITDRKKIEEQLLNSRKSEMIGTLAGGVAHHFNNLLTVIIGYTQMVADGLPVFDPGAANLGIVLNAAERASLLTKQLLAFSNRQMLLFRDLDLNELLASMAGTLEQIAQPPILLRIDLGAEAACVKADVQHVEQIIVSLALNARDAMNGTGGLMTVSTSTAESAGKLYVRLSVSDTGPGIDDRTRAHLFEPFFTTKETGDGTGLGLCSAYGTATQHGGWIGFDTELGVGSTFHLYLPVISDSERHTLANFL